MRRAIQYKECQFIDWRKARKTYKCRDCGKLIVKGDKYLRAYGKCDYAGDWMDACYCEKCGDAFIFCEVEMSNLYEQEFRTAKKRHRCECCGKIIKPGEQYSFEKYFNEDMQKFDSTKLCQFCFYASEDYFDEEGDRQEFVWEEVSEYLQDKYCLDCSKHEEDTCDYERFSDCPIIKAAIFDRRGIEHEQA